MLAKTISIRPRYDEVDRMGYVYHANYVSYCHMARTELLRDLGLQDSFLEENNVMLPVISFNINYKKPAFYDKPIYIDVIVNKMPKVRFEFDFKIRNELNEILSTAKSTVVFANAQTRLPIAMPPFIQQVLEEQTQIASI